MTPQAERFLQIVARPDESIDLAEAALVIASEEYADLDIPVYLARLDELGASLKRRLRADISAADSIAALNRFLFDEHGYTGNSADYYDPRNSFLNDVMDRKCGIPITLSVLYMEVARRIGLAVQGVSFPGHFLVKCTLHEGIVVLDPYDKGASLSLDNLKLRVKNFRHDVEGRPSQIAAMLNAAGSREILVRMLRNLKLIYTHHKDWRRALGAIDRIIGAAPDAAEEYRDRGMIYLSLECFRAALFDLQAYLKMAPAAKDAGAVRNQIVELQPLASRLN